MWCSHEGIPLSLKPSHPYLDLQATKLCFVSSCESFNQEVGQLFYYRYFPTLWTPLWTKFSITFKYFMVLFLFVLDLCFLVFYSWLVFKMLQSTSEIKHQLVRGFGDSTWGVGYFLVYRLTCLGISNLQLLCQQRGGSFSISTLKRWKQELSWLYNSNALLYQTWKIL